MKKITVSVPEETYHAARVHATRRGQSVSLLVCEYLQSLSLPPQQEAEFRRLESQQKRIQQEVHRFSASKRLHRDEVYSRKVC